MFWLVLLLAIMIGSGSLLSALVFAWLYWKRARIVSEPPFQSTVAVVLSVRGLDPYLLQTLTALTEQQGLSYRVVVIVDHRQDPAWSVVSEFVDRWRQQNPDQFQRFEVEELRDHAPQRGLKCSALLQAVSNISEEIVVTIDSDAIPHPNWLLNLVRPLENPSIGATTGNQWFEPSSWNLGSWARSVWHAGAIVPTAVLGNPWAGALAMRREEMESGGLLQMWQSSIIDDGPVRNYLKGLGKRLSFVPQNITINRESCRLSFCLRYVQRMLTWSRLFESTFWITLLHMLIVVGTHAVVFAWLLWAMVMRDGSALKWLSLSLAILLGSQWIGYFLIRATVLSHQDHDRLVLPSGPGLVSRLLLVILGVPLALFAYGRGALRAISTRQILWRQVRYRIRENGAVELTQYHPYQDESPNNAHSV